MGYKELNTFAFFNLSAKRYLGIAEKLESGYALDLMSVMVMSAFSVEAYLNHLGAKKFSDWFSSKEKKSVWEKYKILRKAVGLPPSSLQDAYPDVAAVMDFRNGMAHGRTEKHAFSFPVEGEVESCLDNPVGWQLHLEHSIVSKRFIACQELVKELHAAAGLGNYPFATLASAASVEPFEGL